MNTTYKISCCCLILLIVIFLVYCLTNSQKYKLDPSTVASTSTTTDNSGNIPPNIASDSPKTDGTASKNGWVLIHYIPANSANWFEREDLLGYKIDSPPDSISFTDWNSKYTIGKPMDEIVKDYNEICVSSNDYDGTNGWFFIISRSTRDEMMTPHEFVPGDETDGLWSHKLGKTFPSGSNPFSVIRNKGNIVYNDTEDTIDWSSHEAMKNYVKSKKGGYFRYSTFGSSEAPYNDLVLSRQYFIGPKNVEVYRERDQGMEQINGVSMWIRKKPGINCVKQWSECNTSCDRTTLETITPRNESEQGNNCPASVPKPDCQPGDGACPISDVDCQGTWTECTSSCQKGTAREFTETTPRSGNGAECPTKGPDCKPGDGACPIPDVDCQGTWTECTSSCEKGTDRKFTKTKPRSGNGAECPTKGPDCQPGDGACEENNTPWGLIIGIGIGVVLILGGLGAYFVSKKKMKKKM